MVTAAKHRSKIWLSLGLAFVGGYADAASYILADTFTGHITGNSVLVGVSIAHRDWSHTIRCLLAIGFFVSGIFLSLVVDRLVKRKRSRSPIAVALFLEATLIFIAGLGMGFHHPPNKELFIIFMCLALGLQNGALHKVEGISVHTTFVTGMVTNLVENAFERLDFSRVHRSKSLRQAPPTDPIRLLCELWLAFITGAGAGGVMSIHFKSFTVTAAAFLLLLLAFFTMRVFATMPNDK